MLQLSHFPFITGIYYFNLLVIISCATVTSSWFVVVEKQVVRSGIVPWYFKWLQTNPNGRCCRKQKRGGYEAADIREVNHLHYSSHRPKDEELEVTDDFTQLRFKATIRIFPHNSTTRDTLLLPLSRLPAQCMCHTFICFVLYVFSCQRRL